MRCIFCKKENTSFTSVEHIIPFSLGNKEHTLPKGIVCDDCNNFISRKIEKPLLDAEIFVDLRNRMKVSSRKGKVPNAIVSEFLSFPSQRNIAGFLGKVGLEALAKTALSSNVPNWESDIIDNPGLEPIRTFVRYNNPTSLNWPFYYRTLHPVNAVFYDGKDYFELLHEYDILYTKNLETYIIVSLFGVEFCMNMGGPIMEGFDEWLVENSNASPLYSGKNAAK